MLGCERSCKTVSSDIIRAGSIGFVRRDYFRIDLMACTPPVDFLTAALTVPKEPSPNFLVTVYKSLILSICFKFLKFLIFGASVPALVLFVLASKLPPPLD